MGNSFYKKFKKICKDLLLLFHSPSSYYNILRFRSDMNRTAASLGMNHSYFDAPSGASSTSYTTAYDLYMLSKAFFSNDLLRSYCSTEHCVINQRHITNDALLSGLNVFDCPVSLKTGTWGEKHKALCLNSDNTTLCILSDDPYVFDNIFNVANQIIQGTYSPHNNIAYYGFVNGTLLCHNEDTLFIPASTTKLLTALCVLKKCSLKEHFTIKPSDIMSGSGSQYSPGEIYTIENGIKIMLMESSNTLANALANTCGSRI